MSASAPPLTLNDLLQRSGIAPENVLVFRHRPREPALNTIFGWLPAERPDLFESYQSTHGARTEAALARAGYVASFIRHTPGTALFAGFYKVESSRRITVAEERSRPPHLELIKLGLTGIIAPAGRDSLLEFTMPLTSWHSEWQGRLIVRWPGLERSWYRWADRNKFIVEAIARESLFVQAMKNWDELILEWSQLKLMPTRWAMSLAEWRGIYLITDRSDGKRYVGSAYGNENILQRWREYAHSGHGGNKLLRLRNAENFRFAILQRVSPDQLPADVIAAERTWKLRLGTFAPEGLNEN